MSIFSDNSNERDTHAVAPIPESLRKNKKIAILTADNTEDIEFFYPYYRFTEEGYPVDVITPEGGKFEGKHGLGLNRTTPITDVRPEQYDLLYIPGGKAPAELRKIDEVLAFVKEFADSGKPIAALCHGPQVLISAGLVEGKRMASWPEVGKELEEAGATFVDAPMVEDGQFITGRMPGDLPQHLHRVLQRLEPATSGRNTRQSAA